MVVNRVVPPIVDRVGFIFFNGEISENDGKFLTAVKVDEPADIFKDSGAGRNVSMRIFIQKIILHIDDEQRGIGKSKIFPALRIGRKLFFPVS